MIDNEDCVQLSKYCRGLCVVLETATKGKNPDDLNKHVMMALSDLGRCAD